VQCTGGHLACGACVDALPGGLCETCEEDADGVFGPCPALDTVVSSTRVECPHDGCGRFVVYHESGEHQNACAHAPCRCTEPGCVGFAGSPAALAGHLASVHSVPVHLVKYGKVSQLEVPASVPRLLLVSKDDMRVFMLTVGTLGGAGAAAVSVVCVQASAAARPRFTCKMWVNLQPPPPPNGGKSDVVLVEMQMRSSTSPGAVVAADEPTFLVVLPMYLVPGTSGDNGPSNEVHLSVRIDKVSPWSC
jgi:E3 ubiquitin-protein ligase SIAH1